jgi:hypothetical protein
VGGFLKLFNVDPGAAVPIPVAFVLMPPTMLGSGPLPIIGMNLQFELGLKVRPFGVPAVAIVIAHDFS